MVTNLSRVQSVFHVYHYQRMCFSISRCWWVRFFLSLFFYHHYHDHPHYHHQRKSLLISRCWGVKLRRCLHFFVGLVRGSGAGKISIWICKLIFWLFVFFSLFILLKNLHVPVVVFEMYWLRWSQHKIKNTLDTWRTYSRSNRGQ